MLSYRHAFHAGNFADILKHLVLANTLHHAIRKEAPLLYLDTHAGAGRYDLESVEALKTGEAAAGVLKLDFAALCTAAGETGNDALQVYRQPVMPFLAKNRYPGSPLIAAAILRRQDRLHLCERHPADFALLQAHTRNDSRVTCEQVDGYVRALALLPPVQKRAVVLIDPSYERDEDFRQVVALAAQIHQRMQAAQVLVWYPVVNRHASERMIEALVRKQPRDLWRFELGVQPDGPGRGLTGSGMLVLNPPWTLPAALESCLPTVQGQLAGGDGYWKVERLTAER